MQILWAILNCSWFDEWVENLSELNILFCSYFPLYFMDGFIYLFFTYVTSFYIKFNYSHH